MEIGQGSGEVLSSFSCLDVQNQAKRLKTVAHSDWEEAVDEHWTLAHLVYLTDLEQELVL